METEGPLRSADVFVSLTDPRKQARCGPNLVERLVVVVDGVLAEADKIPSNSFVRRELGK
jgi:hypothetical protein